MGRRPGIGYSIALRLMRLLVRPRASGHLPALGPDATDQLQPVYVLERRSLSDLLVLDLICAANGLPRPISTVGTGEFELPRRVFFLNRIRRGRYRARADAARVAGIETLLERGANSGDLSAASVRVVPVAVFWGLVPSGQGSLLRLLLSEHWAVTSRLRRVVNLFLSRRQIIVDFGTPLTLRDAFARATTGKGALQYINRILRIRLRHQRSAALLRRKDRKSTRLNSSHRSLSRMPSSA